MANRESSDMKQFTRVVIATALLMAIALPLGSEWPWIERILTSVCCSAGVLLAFWLLFLGLKAEEKHTQRMRLTDNEDWLYMAAAEDLWWQIDQEN